MNLRCWSGFTLIELTVVLAVIAIVATFSTPSFVVWHKRDQIDARARSMMFTLMLARLEAIRRGARVSLCRIDAARRVVAAPADRNRRKRCLEARAAHRCKTVSRQFAVTAIARGFTLLERRDTQRGGHYGDVRDAGLSATGGEGAQAGRGDSTLSRRSIAGKRAHGVKR